MIIKAFEMAGIIPIAIIEVPDEDPFRHLKVDEGKVARNRTAHDRNVRATPHSPRQGLLLSTVVLFWTTESFPPKIEKGGKSRGLVRLS